MAAKRKKKRLSERQRAMLLYIEQCISEKSHPPSIREICNQCDISSTSVADYNLRRLEEQGYIMRNRKVSRGIHVLRPIGPMLESEFAVNVPLYGSIAAGEPITIPDADMEPDQFIEVARDLIRAPKSRDLFALRVQGQSMIDALIDDGDIVVLAHQETADNGDLVAAWIASREEWTLKKFFQEGDSITLRPANPAMYSEEDVASKFTFSAKEEDVKISGKVCLVLRQI